MTEKVKEYAEWVYTMIQNPIQRRKEWIKDIFTNLKQGKGLKKNNPQALSNLVDLVTDKNMFELIGFSANLHYIKHDLRHGDEDKDLNCVFVHPWASPKLVYKHKKLPAIIIVGDDLLLDDSVLNNVGNNDSVAVRGFTG